jgi:cytochrome bd-type quinol oxidase subunit 2
MVAIIFGIYGWLCGVECGLSLVRLLPSSTLTRHSLALFTPLWEVANVFLVLGFAGFAILFSHGLVAIGKAVLPSLFAGLILLLIRACLVLYFSYGKARTGLTWPNALFVLVSFGVPLSFGAVGVHLLLGLSFWQSATGWLMMVALAFGMCALALSFVYFVIGRTPHDRLHVLSRTLNISLCVIMAIALQVWLSHRTLRFVHMPYTDFMIFLGFLVVLQAALWRSARERYMWWYLSALALLAPILLVLANRPYLMYPTVRLTDAYGEGVHNTTLATGLIIIVAIVLVGFGVLGWLLVNSKVAYGKRKP